MINIKVKRIGKPLDFSMTEEELKQTPYTKTTLIKTAKQLFPMFAIRKMIMDAEKRHNVIVLYFNRKQHILFKWGNK